MSTPFQNRLVGTVMVAAAAVIFLPDLLDGKKEQLQTSFEGIPNAPLVTDKPVTQAFPKEQLAKIPKKKLDKEQAMADVFEKQPYNQPADEPAVDSASSTIKINTLKKQNVADTSSPSQKKTPELTTDKHVEQAQWVVQLGSFRHEKNVKQLIDKLKANGFEVFTKPIKTKNGSLTKVFVGPELLRSVLEKKLPKLKEITKVNGKVARFTPNK